MSHHSNHAYLWYLCACGTIENVLLFVIVSSISSHYFCSMAGLYLTTYKNENFQHFQVLGSIFGGVILEKWSLER